MRPRRYMPKSPVRFVEFFKRQALIICMTRIPEDLIIRFINNTCSDDELAAVRQWLEESDDNADELFRFEHIAQQASLMHNDDAARRRIKTKISQRIAAENGRVRQRSKRRLILWSTGVAAMFAMLIVSTVYLLRTPDVKMIHVASADKSISVTLPDSTVVYLNKNSKLSYPEQFAADNRYVELSGEGYFEVRRDSKRPFRVSGEYMSVKVLGTHFDFISRGTTANSVSLIEGSVEVFTGNQGGGVVLEPGQKAVYSVDSGYLTIQSTNADVDASWHDRIIPFDNANITEIAEILKQLYDCDIEVQGDVDLDKTYSGVTYYCESLDSTLVQLSNTIPLQFKSTDKKTEIYIK